MHSPLCALQTATLDAAHAHIDTTPVLTSLLQLFWEAFPADGGSARTTYMFAYSDAHPDRPTFERLLDAYFALLPAYQGLGPDGLDALKFKRVLFGGFPCYADSPLKPGGVCECECIGTVD
jgi:lycopene cyclase CruP